MATQVGDYKIDLPTAPEVSGNGRLIFHNVRLHRCTEIGPIVWEEVQEGGHGSLVLQSAVVRPILDGSGTAAQKRSAILDLLIQKIMDKGLAQAHDAWIKFMGVLPGGAWPEGGYSPTFTVD